VKRLLALLLLPTWSAFAGLTWTNTEVKPEVKATDETVTGEFVFKNETTKSITIKETKSSCGCTTAKLEKMTYAPGESGKITALFDIGGRTGPQQKTITVVTDEADAKPTVLALSVDIPDPVQTSAALLTWKKGEKPGEQIFTVKAADGFKVNVTDIRTSNTSFTAKLESGKEGSTYNISVTPAQTTEKAFGLLIVTTDYPPKNPRVVYSQLQVQ
jgi:hypothetical protein